jgi:hypothetical protein
MTPVESEQWFEEFEARGTVRRDGSIYLHTWKSRRRVWIANIRDFFTALKEDQNLPLAGVVTGVGIFILVVFAIARAVGRAHGAPV